MMEIEEEDILRTVANGGPIDFSVWPALLPRIVSRIERIARHEFPIPNLPPPAPTIIPSSLPPTQTESEPTENFLSPLPSSPLEPSSSASSQDTNKENTPIVPRANPPATSAPAPSTPLPPGALPPQIVSMLTEITSTLTSTFPKYPPHTLQRLSELVIAPKHHYRTLPNYLHALDRVVHVTSGLNIYPLPPAIPDMKTASLLSNGVSDILATPSPWATPGSDEALGGALLTPIPWLQPNHHGIGGPSSALGTPGQRSPNGGGSGVVGHSQNSSSSSSSSSGAGPAMELEGEVRTESTETIDGPNGVGSIETVSVSVNGIPSMGARGIGVTQGELLRQEQRAGVVPVSQLVPSHHVHTANPHAQVHNRRASASPSPTPESPQNASAVQGQGQGQAGSLESERTSDVSTPSAAEAGNNTNNNNNTGGSGVGGSAIDGNGNVNAPLVDADAPVGSVTGADEEKPHVRGPEEIGPEDMGPQHGSGSAPIGGSGGAGVEMQGIDVEAAVGRRATSGRGSSKSPPKNSPPADDDDKMDVETSEGQERRGSTPKREAEDELEGSGTKKLKEESGSAVTTTGAEAEGEEGPDVGMAMDTSADGKDEGGQGGGAD
ncbi:hypothetical protein M434DRAFT_353897 [Hypoxylon sp. CO27-5]|nr:hypothetical protein M434DRAFT_353897 [Hypoxylon sp. CO27-5]